MPFLVKRTFVLHMAGDGFGFRRRVDFRNRADAEHQHQHDDNASDNQVRQIDRSIAGVGHAGLGHDETADKERSQNPAQRIAALPEIDARDARLWRTQYRRIRIGDCFQKSQPCANHEQRAEKGGKDDDGRSMQIRHRHKQQRSDNDRHQPDNDARAIAEFPRDPAGGKSHDKICPIPHCLH